MSSTVSTNPASLPKSDHNNLDLSTRGMIYTLIINFCLFVFFLFFFEVNRKYKQIYLKRLQKRFIDIGRVPPNPPEHLFGWLVALIRIPELDVLQMVGLDAYMCMRYQVVCLKFCLFTSAIGLLVLLPTYSTVKSNLLNWDHYTLPNLLASYDLDPRYRLWVAMIFFYIYAAYLCQLLHAEYHNFSLQRLHYLAQADLSNSTDPDSLPQKYYTVMVEKIPAHLRSAEKLYEYFEELFPGEVFTVEVALDLRELNAMINDRKRVRDKLEKAIASYIATGIRPIASIKTGNINILPDGTKGLPRDTEGLLNCLEQLVAPERYGFEKLDAISYYTNKLEELNNATKELQDLCFEFSRTTDKEIQRKLKNKYDTRAAAAVEKLTKQGTKFVKTVKSEGGIESLLFGRPSGWREEDYSHSDAGSEAAVSETHSAKQKERSPSRFGFKLYSSPPQEARRGSRSSATGTTTAVLGEGSSGSIMSSRIRPRSGSGAGTGTMAEKQEESLRPPLLRRTSSETLRANQAEYNLKQPGTTTTVDGDKVGELGGGGGLDDDYGVEKDSSHREGKSRGVRFEEDGTAAAAHASSLTPLEALAALSEDAASPYKPGETKSTAAVGVIGMSSGNSGASSVLSSPDIIKDGKAPHHHTRSISNISDVSMQSAAESVSGYEEGSERDPPDHENDDDDEDYIVVIGSSTRRGKGSGDGIAATTAATVVVGGGKEEEEDDVTSITGIGSVPKSIPRYRGGTGTISSSSPATAATTAPPAKHQPPPQEGGHGIFKNGRLSGGVDITTKARSRSDSHAARKRAGSEVTQRRLAILRQLLPESKLGNEIAEKAKLAGRHGLAQTKIAGIGALKGMLEAERAMEMLVLGAYYKYSSTAFVTFKTRMAETISQQMLLTNDAMEINPAPHPNDIIWENVAIPKTQIIMRSYITQISLTIGSIFWSTLVTKVNDAAKALNLPENQQNYFSVVVLLMFLILLPFIFDSLARFYVGMKLESEIQNAIMTWYFYYQLVNIYVIVGLGGVDIIDEIMMTLRDPQTLVELLGGTIPSVSLYFCNLVIVKIFAAVPIEMLRPWQLSTILLMGNCMDRRKCTRRELRTGAFFAWPMLYGWIYPQLMMVLMIMVTYACISPILMPFGVIFFSFAYVMYKYQLLYVYINNEQSGGYMWYAAFNRSLIALLFANFTFLAYLGLHMREGYYASGPFYCLLPCPISILYFWHYCDGKFRSTSMNLSFGLAKQIDHYNNSRKAVGQLLPHDSFKQHLFRQPTLTEPSAYPEPYRKDGEYGFLDETARARATPLGIIFDGKRSSSSSSAVRDGDSSPERIQRARSFSVTAGQKQQQQKERHRKLRSASINVHELMDESEDTIIELEEYFRDTVLPLARTPMRVQSSQGDVDSPPTLSSPIGSPSHTGLSPGLAIQRKVFTAGNGDADNNATSKDKDHSGSGSATSTAVKNPLHDASTNGSTGSATATAAATVPVIITATQNITPFAGSPSDNGDLV